MPNFQSWSMSRVAGVFLILGSVADYAGVWMYSIRQGAVVGLAATRSFFVTERTLLVAAVIFTALGFILLEGAFRDKNGQIWARLGAAAYLFAATLITTAELLALNLGFERVQELVVMYVVIAFIAQALIGAALYRSRLVATWIGGATLLWNIAWLARLLIAAFPDIYFPVLHHVLPLVIGVALVRGEKITLTKATLTGVMGSSIV